MQERKVSLQRELERETAMLADARVVPEESFALRYLPINMGVARVEEIIREYFENMGLALVTTAEDNSLDDELIHTRFYLFGNRRESKSVKFTYFIDGRDSFADIEIYNLGIGVLN